MRAWPGRPRPLGDTWDGEGVNFALYSARASAVELNLFDRPGAAQPSHRFPMTQSPDGVWHAYLPDARPGCLYGYRVDGPYAPEEGHRFNRHKLLLDPYARAVAGKVRWRDEVFGYRVGDPAADLSFDGRDSAGFVPKGMVVDPAFTWGDDRPPGTPWDRTVIYECHVRGMTMRHPGVPERLRGTYLGLASEPVLDHLVDLGVTAVELLPVHQFIGDRRLSSLNLSNYWGYNPVAYFAPHAAYATAGEGQQVGEFKSMVRALHRAGLEVIVDVVYNHTGEGDRFGPTLSLRGIDNAAYYRLDPQDRRHLQDFTGTGNSLNVVHPRAMGLVMDSLRYWVTDMHVDGFRFDLAPVLARGVGGSSSAFLEIVRHDPVLATVKLIAEPWDAGPDGYRLGRFPEGWAEWNGAYRDCVRRFWRGDPGQVPELASRLTGSSDLFEHTGRGTYASVNFVTCHDGFTLTDLVSYERRHNEANGEGNADGTPDDLSRNWGAEGPSDAVRIERMRDRMRRNLLTTLMCSQGVRMLLGGDELGRTQLGNNNAYCQDNAVSWVDWELDEGAAELTAFVCQLAGIVAGNPILRRRRFFTGAVPPGSQRKDVTWVRADGEEMGEDDWADPDNRTLGMLLNGRSVDEVDDRGRRERGAMLVLYLHAGTRSRSCTLPRVGGGGRWQELVNTARPSRFPRDVRTPAVHLAAQSCLLLRRAE